MVGSDWLHSRLRGNDDIRWCQIVPDVHKLAWLVLIGCDIGWYGTVTVDEVRLSLMCIGWHGCCGLAVVKAEKEWWWLYCRLNGNEDFRCRIDTIVHACIFLQLSLSNFMWISNCILICLFICSSVLFCLSLKKVEIYQNIWNVTNQFLARRFLKVFSHNCISSKYVWLVLMTAE